MQDKCEITRLSAVPRRPQRLLVEAAPGGPPAVEIGAEVLARLGLGVGSRLSHAQWEAMLAADLEERCRLAAWRLVSQRPFGRVELTRSLRKRRYPATLVDSIVDDLAAKGYVSDAVFARTFAQERRTRREGPRLIEQRLRARGVPREEARAALEPLGDREKLLADAEELVRRWNRRSRPGDDAHRARAAGAHLLRRGYPHDIAREAVRRALGADPAGE